MREKNSQEITTNKNCVNNHKFDKVHTDVKENKDEYKEEK